MPLKFSEEPPLVDLGEDDELVAEELLAIGLLVDAEEREPLDVLLAVGDAVEPEELPVAPNFSWPAVMVTGSTLKSVPESVVVFIPGKFALSPPALVRHTAVVACVFTSQLKLKLKSSPGGVMLAWTMEPEMS